MIFKKIKMKSSKFLILIFSALLFSCTVENVDDISSNPKTDFSDYNYVLATEDASDVDITTFFSFNLDEIDPDYSYDLIGESMFVNSNPSTSSGHLSFDKYIFSQAKDKKGFSSSPGLYRLTLNDKNQIFIDSELNVSRANLFPARQIAMANKNLAYFYNEGKDPYKIQVFDPSNMILLRTIDLKPAIEEFKPDAVWEDAAGNNLVRTGSFALHVNEGKLYVSIAFLEAVAFNLIADEEEDFYVAVVDIESEEVEKIITYHGAKNVGFYVSENKATSADEDGNLYFCSWGWNQFNAPFPSKVFRIPSGETDFDQDWIIDIEAHFGPDRIAQSMISFNNKLYLHISEEPYNFSTDVEIKMGYYEVDPHHPDQLTKLDIPSSDLSDRMNVFNIVDDKLFIAVPNKREGKFNGLYSLDKNGNLKKEITIKNKYRPTRFYKLQD